MSLEHIVNAKWIFLPWTATSSLAGVKAIGPGPMPMVWRLSLSDAATPGLSDSDSSKSSDYRRPVDIARLYRPFDDIKGSSQRCV